MKSNLERPVSVFLPSFFFFQIKLYRLSCFGTVNKKNHLVLAQILHLVIPTENDRKYRTLNVISFVIYDTSHRKNGKEAEKKEQT